ncbi:UNVERIFIED_CONTAM: sister chromatid cohesion protein 1 [Siphonaria sp. JEL0065]|nr:sister chromatid cohesion protein 1 [Siphonaria sp. JEL0065]
MFFSDSILSKKGGSSLAKVWLAAHWERKLSKSQFIQANIQVSVGAIVGDSGQPMALRLSGQLLLGVVRIYSRKARYLLEDCNEALVKIKMAFRPGVVDMPDEQTMAHFNAITLSETINEFDILLPEPSFNINNFNNNNANNEDFSYTQQESIPASQSQATQNVSRQSDITIRDQTQSATRSAHHLNLPSSVNGLDLLDMEHGMDMGVLDGDDDILSFDFGGGGVVSSSNFAGFDGASREIEVGRDAGAQEKSFHLDDSLDISRIGAAAPKDGDDDGMDLDLGNEFGAGDLEIGLDNRVSSVGVLGGGIEEMSFDVGSRDPQIGDSRAESVDGGDAGWNGYEEDPIPRGADEDFELMDLEADKENEFDQDDNNAIFDVATTPVGNKITGIKKTAASAAAATPKKTPAKRATKSTTAKTHAAKKRKVAVADEMTEIPAKQIMEQLANTSSITVMETYVPTSQIMINLLAARRNKDYLRPMHSGLNPKLAALFSSRSEIMPLGPIQVSTEENIDGVPSMREELVVFTKENTIVEEEEDANKELLKDKSRKEESLIQNDDSSSHHNEELHNWDDADRAFPDEDFAPMEDGSLVFNASQSPSKLQIPSGVPAVTEEELESVGPTGGDDEFQDLVEDELVAAEEEEEEANVSLTNGASMSRSTMSTIELLQHKFATSDTVTLNQMLPRKPNRSEAARMFFEVLVLKTKDLVGVQQDKPYGSIVVTERPLLATQIAA